MNHGLDCVGEGSAGKLTNSGGEKRMAEELRRSIYFHNLTQLAIFALTTAGHLDSQAVWPELWAIFLLLVKRTL